MKIVTIYRGTEELGFTLVELIIAMVVAGIVSAVVISRFVDSNAFNAIVARDQIIAMVRNAQQSALGRSNVALTLTPTVDGSELVVTRSDSGGEADSVTVDIDSVSLSADINLTSSCGSTGGQASITNATPLTINFGELGSLTNSGVTGAVGAVNSALRICLNNDPVFSVCVSPSGFAYAGDCEN